MAGARGRSPGGLDGYVRPPAAAPTRGIRRTDVASPVAGADLRPLRHCDRRAGRGRGLRRLRVPPVPGARCEPAGRRRRHGHVRGAVPCRAGPAVRRRRRGGRARWAGVAPAGSHLACRRRSSRRRGSRHRSSRHRSSRRGGRRARVPAGASDSQQARSRSRSPSRSRSRSPTARRSRPDPRRPSLAQGHQGLRSGRRGARRDRATSAAGLARGARLRRRELALRPGLSDRRRVRVQPAPHRRPVGRRLPGRATRPAGTGHSGWSRRHRGESAPHAGIGGNTAGAGRGSRTGLPVAVVLGGLARGTGDLGGTAGSEVSARQVCARQVSARQVSARQVSARQVSATRR
jgi:hypothetical protein